MTHVSLSGIHRGPGNFYLWNPESGKFLLLESRTLSFMIPYSTQANRNPANGCNPESKFHAQSIRNPTAGIRNPRRGIQNPRLCIVFFQASAVIVCYAAVFSFVTQRSFPKTAVQHEQQTGTVMVAENSLEKILEVNYHINTQRKNETPLNTVLLVNFLKGFFFFLNKL